MPLSDEEKKRRKCKNEVWGFNPSFFCWRANQTYDLFNLSE